jgi:hypothetical protein
MRRSSLPILALALALVLSACGGGVRSTTPTTSTLPAGAVATTSAEQLQESGHEGEGGSTAGGEQAPVPTAGQEPATSGAGGTTTTTSTAGG